MSRMGRAEESLGFRGLGEAVECFGWVRPMARSAVAASKDGLILIPK